MSSIKPITWLTKDDPPEMIYFARPGIRGFHSDPRQLAWRVRKMACYTHAPIAQCPTIPPRLPTAQRLSPNAYSWLPNA